MYLYILYTIHFVYSVYSVYLFILYILYIFSIFCILAFVKIISPSCFHISPNTRSFRGRGGVGRGLDFQQQAKVCTRELASVVSRGLHPAPGLRRLRAEASALIIVY